MQNINNSKIKKTISLVTATFLLTGQFLNAASNVTSANSSTKVFESPNGTTVVNIATPNTSGLSHNQYTNYNVDETGLILNNMNPDTAEAQSLLAGKMIANQNLENGVSASVILNEVVSTNRSTLAGFTEVFGETASVIVANPYGITVNGAGFINADSVTLTTGTPIIIDGEIDDYSVTQGDILVEGDGLVHGETYISGVTDDDAYLYTELYLISRKIKLDGQVNADYLEINTNGDGSGTKPTYAIESSVLGGMYATDIYIMANEDGVGVKLDGEAYASSGSFSLDANGEITITNNISAPGDDGGEIALYSSSGDNITVGGTDKSLTASWGVNIESSGQTGDITFVENTNVVADYDISITGKDLTNPGIISSNNGMVNIDLSGTLDNTGEIQAETYSTIIADSVENSGTMALSETEWTSNEYEDSLKTKITVSDTINNTGTIYSTRDLEIKSPTLNLINSSIGLIATAGKLSLEANNLTNNNNILAENDIDINILNALLLGANSVLNSKASIVLAAVSYSDNNTSEISATNDIEMTLPSTFTNTGIVHSGRNLTFKNVTDFTNNGSLIALKNLAFGEGATFVGENIPGYEAYAYMFDYWPTTNINSLTNSGTIHAGESLYAYTTDLTNQQGAILSSGNDQSVTNSDYMTLIVENQFTNNGSIYSKGDLTVKANGYTNNYENFTNSFINSNTGTILSDGALKILVDNTLQNSNTIESGNTLKIFANEIQNNTSSSKIASTDAMKLIVGATRDDFYSNAVQGKLTNTGLIYSKDKLDIVAFDIENVNSSSKIISLNDLTISHREVVDFDITEAIGLNGLNNGGNTKITNNGLIHSNTDLKLDINQLVNSNTAGLSALGDLFIYKFNAGLIGDLTNSGSIYAGDLLRIDTYEESFVNTGELNSTGNTLINIYQGDFTNNKTIFSDANITINGDYDFTNETLSSTTLEAQIIAANTLNLNIGTSGFNNNHSNLGANLSASTVNITQANDSTFTNTPSGTFGGGIYAGTLNTTGGNFLNSTSSGGALSSSTSTSNPDTTLSDTTRSDTDTSSNDYSALYNITLPTNPNGYFVVNVDNNSRYLVETNPLYGEDSIFPSTIFLEESLGIDPDSVVRHLGDANYEAKLIRDQLNEQLGRNLIGTGLSEAEQMQQLMENAVSQASSNNLVYGQALTKEQQENLEEDIVWMVETVVQGHKVLAPVVYLSNKTKNTINSSLMANDATFDVNSFENRGSTIATTEKLDIKSKEDIKNISGKISGGDVNLTSTEGSVINETELSSSWGKNGLTYKEGNTATIESTGNLNINAKQNVENTGAKISGENVNITTEDGDILNKTRAITKTNRILQTGGKTYKDQDTFIGNSASIESKNSLNLDSGNNITLEGAKLDSGGDANINAKGNFEATTIVDKTSKILNNGQKTVYSEGRKIIISLDPDYKSTEKNIGSQVNIGGKLNINTGENTTIKGSDVTVKDSTTINSGGNVEILSVQDKTTTQKSSYSHSSGGFLGLSSTTTTSKTETFIGKNKASNVDFGNSANINAGNKFTLQGSNVKMGDGDSSIDAKNGIEILDGLDETRVKTQTKSTSILGGSGSLDASGSASVGTEVGTENDATNEALSANAQAGAQAGASAEASGGASGTINLFSSTDITVETNVKKSVASKLISGGNLKLNSSDGDVTVQGSDVETKGNLDIEANNVNVLAGRNETTTTTDIKKKSFDLGFTAEGQAGASAQSQAGAEANATGENAVANANAEAGASAEAEAGAEGAASFTAGMTTTNIKKEEYDLTHTAASLKSGGNMTIKSKENTTIHGSNVDVGGDFTNEGKNITYSASEDVHTEKTTTNTSYSGVYLDIGSEAKASATAEAGANAEGTSGYNGTDAGAEASANAEAGANAEASAEFGIQQTNTTEVYEAGSKTYNSTQINVGGNMKRTAENKITDEALSLDVGGDFQQEAKEIEMKATYDTSYEKTSYSKTDAKVGVKVVADAEAKAEAGASAGTSENDAGAEADAGAGARAGVHANVKVENEQTSSTSTTANTGSYNIGGNLKSTSTEKTTIEGADINVQGDAEIQADSLDYKAAYSTESSSSSSSNVEADVEVTGGIGSDSIDASASLGVGTENSDSSSQEATTGSLNANNLTIKTNKDANFEGTNIEVENDANIQTGGDLNFTAAKNKEQSSSNSVDVEVNASFDGEALEADANVGVSNESESSTTSVTGGITSKNGNVNLKSDGDMNFEGTSIDAKENVDIEADSLNYKAAFDETKSNSSSVEAGAELNTGDSELTLSAEVEVNSSSSSTAQTGSISGNNINVTTKKDANFDGTQIEAQKDINIESEGNVNFNAVQDTQKEDSLSVNAEVGVGEELSLEAGLEAEGSSSTTSTTSSLSSNNGTINVKSKNNITLEDTEISGNNVSLDAENKIIEKEAVNTSSEYSVGVEVSGSQEIASEEEEENTEEGN